MDEFDIYNPITDCVSIKVFGKGMCPSFVKILIMIDQLRKLLLHM